MYSLFSSISNTMILKISKVLEYDYFETFYLHFTFFQEILNEIMFSSAVIDDKNLRQFLRIITFIVFLYQTTTALLKELF